MMPQGPPQEDPNQPYPGLGMAFLLTIAAIFASVFTGVAFYGLGALAAYGIGRALGVGAVATLAAQRVGEPQAERLGLRKIEADAIPVVLCLVPAMLLVSEMDNYVYDWAGDEPSMIEQLEQERAERAGRLDADGEALTGTTPPEAAAESVEGDLAGDVVPEIAYDEEGRVIDADAAGDADADGEPASDLADVLDPGDPASLLQAFVVMVGIIPIVDCFLVFGVIQQGLVRRMGAPRGIAFAALLWMLLRPVPMMGTTQFLVVSVATLGLGGLLGLVRIATRSIAGPMILAAGWAGVQFLALATLETMPLPGLNVPGTHLPLTITLASLGMVGWAAYTLYGEAEADLLAPPDATGAAPSHRSNVVWFPGYEDDQDEGAQREDEPEPRDEDDRR